MKRLGFFGGTFDPVHIAHLRLALELKAYCQLDEMRLLPAHIPPHKGVPSATPSQRLAMLQLAIQHCPELSLDTRELLRDCPSYSVETLAQLRAELGPQVSISLAVGGDSLANLHTWHRWRELFQYAHLIVAVRPGYQRPQSGPVAELLADSEVEVGQLHQVSHGGVVVAELSQLAVSATAIREQIASGYSAQFLLPDPVWHYIQQHRLYQQAGADQ
ncbi:nicotinate-nucleotide adenylyltransferase [Halioxenophilus sp. WMMB6]|uniref:nicotinate-nucleotide adenylyltransferase n=1 Tax=Halioxenophilus sp. WMMB6 TaxID=3073815 RepID=UPI00295E28FF|nr:nicotinate-nucleotide adenylyltransferase [Halioxenophilus sp. WMMB6]